MRNVLTHHDYWQGVHGAPTRWADLFPLCSCDDAALDACGRCSATPRTVDALFTALSVLGDDMLDDIHKVGSQPLDPTTSEVSVLDQYPAITYKQNQHWRLQAAESYPRLAKQLLAGLWPHPETLADQMAWWLTLRLARALVEDEAMLVDPSLPASPRDYDWVAVEDECFPDLDVLMLFDPAVDGIEDVMGDLNAVMGVGDMHPPTWFIPRQD